MIVGNTGTKTVYVDLGNSFFIRNGEVTPYYTPSATTTVSGTSGGASVNLGSVADAFGVGGIVGTLAGGINVGGGKSSSSSTVTYAQRVVAIPPKSEIKLEFQRYFHPNSECWKFTIHKYNKKTHYLEADPRFEINRGEVLTYTEEDNILNYSVRIAYAFDETCQQINSLYADMYLKEILGGKLYSYGNGFNIDEKCLTSNWKDVIYMVVDNQPF